MHDYTHQYDNHTGELRISIIPNSIESLHHCVILWIITTHVSLGNLEKQWRMFTRQLDRTQQLLNSLLQKPLTPTHLFSTLEAELTSLDSIHTSYKPLILAATQLLKNETSFSGVLVSNKHVRRSLLPFLWVMDSAGWYRNSYMTKDVRSIKKRVNQLIASTTQPTGRP